MLEADESLGKSFGRYSQVDEKDSYVVYQMKTKVIVALYGVVKLKEFNGVTNVAAWFLNSDE